MSDPAELDLDAIQTKLYVIQGARKDVAALAGEIRRLRDRATKAEGERDAYGASERRLEAENARLRRASRTRADYDLRCEDCGAAHNLDTSIPSEFWDAICENPGAESIGMPEVGVLCTLCIDERLQKAGLKCDVAEFYYVGTALSGRLYAESTGEIQNLELENARLREELERTREQRNNWQEEWNKAKAALRAQLAGPPVAQEEEPEQ